MLRAMALVGFASCALGLASDHAGAGAPRARRHLARGRVELSHPPTDIANVSGVIPLGNLNPGGGHLLAVNHMYLGYPFPATDSAYSYPVYAMGDGAVVMVIHTEMAGLADAAWEVFISHGSGVTSYFIHLHGISTHLQQVIAATPDAAWMKAGTPGDDHKFLEPVIGMWNVKVTNWETPGGPPMSSTGTAEATWVLDGRFVKESFKGDFNGMPFEGLGFTGYDNLKKKYTASWMDSMSTMTMILTGSADRAKKVLTMTGTMDDVMTGKPMAITTVTRIVDAGSHVYEMYGPDKAGKQFKMMEIVYTRK